VVVIRSPVLVGSWTHRRAHRGYARLGPASSLRNI